MDKEKRKAFCLPLQSMLKQDYLRTVLIGIVTVVVLIMSKLFFWKKKKRIWLIGCGSERWGDNADAFWRYMIKEHPEIRVVAVVKNKTALNTKNIYWVKRNSLKNYFFIMQAEVFATTHTLSEIGPDNITSFSNAKKVWLQHGVTGIG
ncbi:MAG: CDP-glycerol glycerophosphotransferase family protein, partial [Bacteroidales bacterium]